MEPVWPGRRSPASLDGMVHRRAAAAAIVLVVLAVAGALAAVALSGGGEDERAGGAAIDRYLAAWGRGDDAGAAGLTDRPGAARRVLEMNRGGLDGATVSARVVDRRDDERESAARVRVTWEV